jgi:hypothetical protein
MTGKEKIQAVVDIINEERRRIIKGSVVEISSETLSNKGLSFEDQQQVLDLLAKDKKWIRYTFEYFSGRKVETIVDRLKPDLIRLMPVKIFTKQSEEPLIYTIEVLENYGRRNNPAAKKKTATKIAVNVADSPTHEVSLLLKRNTLRLFVDKKPSLVVKKFKTKKANNIIAYWNLQLHKGNYLSKEDMHIRAKSKVKDLPKTMGIKGLLADYFIDIDSKSERLRLPKEPAVLSREELESLLAYVNRISKEN